MMAFERLAVALALGLLIGLERGWHERGAAEGQRIAGLRTFGLIGLLGALWAMLAEELGVVLLGIAFAAFTALLITGHVLDVRENRDRGITTVVAALLTFVLGALAMRGHLAIAASVAVITTILLGLKPQLHEWLQKLQQQELFATFKLLLISVVMLPVLPDQGYGPWGALNPYELWWLVVLIAGIAFAGYFAVKIVGARRGILLTGLFGGLASSTAVTLSFSRLGKRSPGAQTLLAAGVVVAAATMFPRMLLEVGVVNRALLPHLVWPLGVMTVLSYLAVPLLWRQGTHHPSAGAVEFNNPFELLPALKFGLLLAAVMLLAKGFEVWFGTVGVYLLAGISGISDVDAITLSLARLARDGLSVEVAARAAVLAAMVNTLVKGGMVAVICGGAMGQRVGLVFALAVAGGGLTLLLLR